MQTSFKLPSLYMCLLTAIYLQEKQFNFWAQRVVDFQNSRFFIPPKLKPLNLDLASLKGGGVSPAQYEGKTHEGCDVYCRYRGGRFSVTVANSPNAKTYQDGKCLLDIQIGPLLHGSLSLGQLCQYAGITINGDHPPLPTEREMKQNRFLDLSGKTTFYDAYLNCTKETGMRLMQQFLCDVSKTSIVQLKHGENYKNTGGGLCTAVNDITSRMPYLLVGEQPSKELLSKLSNEVHLEDLCPTATLFSVSFKGFNGDLRSNSCPASIAMAEHLKRQLNIAGENGNCLYSTLWIRASFPTKDQTKILIAEAIDRIVDLNFPQQLLHCYSLDNGQRRPELDYKIHIDSAVLKWIANGEGRWLYPQNAGDRDAPEYVAFRPSIGN